MIYGTGLPYSETLGPKLAAGGEVVGIEDTGVCHMGYVKDPDGNVVILHRRYAPRTT